MTGGGFEDLRQLLGCYFHQDWVCEFEDEQAATAAMIERSDRRRIEGAIVGIRELLAAPHRERDLQNLLLVDCGCCLDPTYRGVDHREWLQEILLKLEAWAAANSSS